MKLFIFCLLTLCGSAVGGMFSLKLSLRCENLEKFLNMLEYIRAEIRYTHTALPTIFGRIKNELDFFVSDRLVAVSENAESFIEEWKSCLEKVSSLTQQDVKALMFLGSSLGKSEIQGQMSVIDLTRDRLTTSLENAREEKNRKGRLYITLGIMLGAGVGILML